MSDTVWIKHPETGHVAEVPRAALPMYRQSNWDVLSDEELDALERELVDEAAEAEAAMREQAGIALGAAPQPVIEPESVRTEDELRELGESAVVSTEPPTAAELAAVPGPHTADEEAIADALPEPKDATGRRSKKENA